MAHEPRSLRQAANLALSTRWKGTRTYGRAYSQVWIIVNYLEGLGCSTIEDVTTTHVEQLKEWSRSRGLRPASINARMSILSGLGIQASYVRLSRDRKWFLSYEDETKLDLCMGIDPLLLAFVKWTVTTGCRVEESLALMWRDVDLVRGTVHVPGTKTDMAEATLPLSEEALRIITLWHAVAAPSGGGRVFPITYLHLRDRWNVVRKLLGWGDIPTATLKSLRRSFARRAHVKGMPVDILRQYLRHSSLKTTQGYLWLVGGYSQDEMRRWL